MTQCRYYFKDMGAQCRYDLQTWSPSETKLCLYDLCICIDMGGCQNYDPFLVPYYNTAPNILGYSKKDHDFDNHPYGCVRVCQYQMPYSNS